MDDFETAAIQPNESIGPNEAKVLLENKERWNDEEKVRFESLTEEGFVNREPEVPVDETPTVPTAPVVPETPATPVTPEPAPPVTPPVLSPEKVKEEISAFVDEKKKELADAGASKAEQKEAEDRILEIWGYKKGEDGKLFIPKEDQPKDWNDAFTRFVGFIRQHPEVLFKDTAPYVRGQMAELNAQDQAKVDTEMKKYDAEVADLYKEGKMPNPATDEGKKVDMQLTQIAIQYGLTSLKDAHNLWSKIPVEHGGGYVPQGVPASAGTTPVAPAVDQKKEAASAQKKAAAKVGSSGAGGVVPSKGGSVSYSDIHTKSMDQIMSEVV